jgi:hypothetical protein
MQIIPESGKGLYEFLAELRLHVAGRDLVLLPAQGGVEIFPAQFSDLGNMFLLHITAAPGQGQDQEKPAEKFPARPFHKKVLSLACILDGLVYLIH